MATGQIKVVRKMIEDILTGNPKEVSYLEIDGKRLSCGDALEVLLPDGWSETRLEMKASGDWYFTNLNFNPVGIIARINE